jgi:hypothetical protein
MSLVLQLLCTEEMPRQSVRNKVAQDTRHELPELRGIPASTPWIPASWVVDSPFRKGCGGFGVRMIDGCWGQYQFLDGGYGVQFLRLLGKQKVGDLRIYILI